MEIEMENIEETEKKIMTLNEIAQKIVSASRPRHIDAEGQLIKFDGEDEFLNMTEEEYQEQKRRFYETLHENPMLCELSENKKFVSLLEAKKMEDQINYENLERFMIMNATFLNDCYYRSIMIKLSDPENDDNQEKVKIISKHVPYIIFNTKPSSAIDQIFDYIKAYSVAIPVKIINSFRFSKYTDNIIMRILFSLTINTFMILNIFEAVVTDLINGNCSNALAGFILILKVKYFSLFYVDDVTKEVKAPHYDKDWIDIYTSWNFCFIYGSLNYDTIPRVWSKLGSAIYATQEEPNHNHDIYDIYDNGQIRHDERWLSSRAYTLGMLIAQSWVDPQIRNEDNWKNNEINKKWGEINKEHAKEYFKKFFTDSWNGFMSYFKMV